MARKPHPPGQHGKDGRPRKLSEYGMQLREKQKARFLYGLQERQFRRLFEQAVRSAGATGDTLMSLLERRLDNVVYRMGLAATRAQARQLVNHGHVWVNGKSVDIASYSVVVGETVSVRPKSRETNYFKELVGGRGLDRHITPPWLRFDAQALSAEVISIPQREHAEQLVDPQIIVEFYSR
jgi:small subunit ribosomal protein S4